MTRSFRSDSRTKSFEERMIFSMNDDVTRDRWNRIHRTESNEESSRRNQMNNEEKKYEFTDSGINLPPSDGAADLLKRRCFCRRMVPGGGESTR